MKIRKSKAAGFTLVEMLVVIAIIGILASLISVAAVNVLYEAKQARIKAELDQIDMALKSFKTQYGAYPPCDLRISSSTAYPNQNALMAFLMQAFPRYINNANPTNIAADLTAAGVDTSHFRPDAAIVFWLQGFNPDATRPFNGVPTTNATAATPTFSTTIYTPAPLYNFDQTRLKVVTAAGGTASFVYVPSNQTSPYVYFDLGTYGNLGAGISAPSGSPLTVGNPAQFTVMNTDGSTGGTATPYALDVNANGTLTVPPDTFCNPTSFQIISAGQDNQFGTFGSQFRLFPTGSGYDATGLENDNVTNFNEKSSLYNALPN